MAKERRPDSLASVVRINKQLLEYRRTLQVVGKRNNQPYGITNDALVTVRNKYVAFRMITSCARQQRFFIDCKLRYIRFKFRQ